MNEIKQKQIRLNRRKSRVRLKIRPRAPRPRLVFQRSNRALRVQVIDDVKSVTLCSAGTDEKGFAVPGKNRESAKKLGEVIAQRALEKGVKNVVLDRRGILYHGRIADFADAAREKGLGF